MAARRRQFSMDHPVVLTFLIIAIVASMSLAAEVLKPLALAMLLSFALAPLCRLLERAKVPHGLAVVLAVTTALGALGVVIFVVGRQLTTLASELPQYEQNIKGKLENLKPRSSQQAAFDNAKRVATDVARTLGEAPSVKPHVTDVRVVEQPSFRERLVTAVGPYLEWLGVGSLILILVLFMLLSRDDLSARILELFGRGQLTLTTRTMDEVAQRISRYLAMFAMVNTTFGVILGIGLWLTGVRLAVLWGFLAAVLRFIPYVGPATAFTLPFLFAFASFPGWREPVLVLLLFGALEVVANSYLEPVIYGKTTGVSALGLLVAAMFWTWLWGALGLLLSTPLTVCLAVLGKYVPSLRFFAIVLGEDIDIGPDVRFYQRLLALDQDGAIEVVESTLRKQPRVTVFDEIFIPALIRAERDAARGHLEENEQIYLWRVIEDWLGAQRPEEATPLPGAGNGTAGGPAGQEVATTVGPAAPVERLKLLGLPVSDRADILVLRMLDLTLRPSGLELDILEESLSPLALADVVASRSAEVVILSHLPPIGLTPTRYLVRRLRARFESFPILVGRWSERTGPTEAADRLISEGASRVVFRLAEARDRILELAAQKKKPMPDTDPTPVEPSPETPKVGTLATPITPSKAATVS